MEKVYVARVVGAFPATEAPIVVDVPLAWDPVSNHARAVPGDCPPPDPAAAQPGQASPGGAPAEPSLEAGQQVQQQPQSHPGQEQEQQQQLQEGGLAGCQAALPAAAGLGAGAAPPGELPRQQASQARQQSGGEGNSILEGMGAEPSHEQAQQQQAQPKKPSRAERRAAKRSKKTAAAAAAGAAEAGGGSRDGAKPAQTEYRLLWVAPDGQTSLVECRSVMGCPAACLGAWGAQTGG